MPPSQSRFTYFHCYAQHFFWHSGVDCSFSFRDPTAVARMIDWTPSGDRGAHLRLPTSCVSVLAPSLLIVALLHCCIVGSLPQTVLTYTACLEKLRPVQLSNLFSMPFRRKYAAPSSGEVDDLKLDGPAHNSRIPCR